MADIAHASLDRAGMRSPDNRGRLIAWWCRWEQATGAQPDVMAHLRTLRRGLRFPIERHHTQGFTLRTCGEARTRNHMETTA